MFYRCVELVDNVCVAWIESQPLLPAGAGLKIGGALLSITALAWGSQQIARFIMNR